MHNFTQVNATQNTAKLYKSLRIAFATAMNVATCKQTLCDAAISYAASVRIVHANEQQQKNFCTQYIEQYFNSTHRSVYVRRCYNKSYSEQQRNNTRNINMKVYAKDFNMQLFLLTLQQQLNNVAVVVKHYTRYNNKTICVQIQLL